MLHLQKLYNRVSSLPGTGMAAVPVEILLQKRESIWCEILTSLESPNSAEGAAGRDVWLTKCSLPTVYL